MEQQQENQKKIGEYWSNRSNKSTPNNLPLGWWQLPYLVRCINQQACGEPLDGQSRGLLQIVKHYARDRLPLARGVSVGCGNGHKEMVAIESGLATAFDLYELSAERIKQGRQLAARRGLQDRVRFLQGDAFQLATAAAQYDLVYWNNSLHHMMDVPAALQWSRHVLKANGLFLMDDFVGPDRLQWSQEILDIASGVRQGLDKKYLLNSQQPDTYLPTHVAPPNATALIARDPSEAADSSRILPAVAHWFPEAEVRLTGGIVYFVALSSVLNNFDEQRDRELLDELMALDRQYAEQGLTAYATAMGIKRADVNVMPKVFPKADETAPKHTTPLYRLLVRLDQTRWGHRVLQHARSLR